METIKITIGRNDVYDEVAKATDYTGSKLIESDERARDRILITDEDLRTLSRFWEEAALGVNENFKEMMVASGSDADGFTATLEVSKSFDKSLRDSVESTLRSYFITAMTGQWFKFANKGEAGDYLTQAAEMLTATERMLYSRRRPALPKD